MASFGRQGDRFPERSSFLEDQESPGRTRELGKQFHICLTLSLTFKDLDDEDEQDDANSEEIDQDLLQQPDKPNSASHPAAQEGSHSSRAVSPGPPLMNPLVLGSNSYFADTSGRPSKSHIYLGAQSC